MDDQIGAAYILDLACLLVDMIETDRYGCYHATSEGGYISWTEFAAEIFRQMRMNVKAISIITAECGFSKAARSCSADWKNKGSSRKLVGNPPHKSRFARQLPPRGKPSFLAFPLRGRWTAEGGTDEVYIPQENVKNQNKARIPALTPCRTGGTRRDGI